MKHNFTAGPCVLPKSVLKEASEAVVDYNGSGLSVVEMSHRSAAIVDIMEEARSLVKEVLNVPDGYGVLFLQGGASTGFLTSAYNLMKEGGSACFLDTGAWSSKAIKEAKRLGAVEVVGSSEDKNYNYIPKNYPIKRDASYLHLTSNNTIFGTQIKQFPVSTIPMICDMSSDIFSREINVGSFDLIYAGAQKNLGPAGTTLYIVKESALGNSGRDIPSMLDLQIHLSKDSMFNTPPVFAFYVSMLTLRWVKGLGGISAMQERNQAKADLLYNEIDRNGMFEGTAAGADRSNMNATFVLTNEDNKEAFDQMWNDAGIVGLKGHRSVGGYRASMYNALEQESVQVLVDVMKEFESKFG